MIHHDPSNFRTPDFYDAGYSDESYAAPAATLSGFRWVWLPAVEILAGNPWPIIDLGCGCGHFAEVAIKNGFSYRIGIDLSEVAIKRARARLPYDHFEHGAICDFLTSEHEYGRGLYVLLEVLEHMTLEAGRETLRLIPEGEDILISVPNFETDGHVLWFDALQDVLIAYQEFIAVEKAHVSGQDGQHNAWFLVYGKRRSS